jgi:hypothetical protein
MKYVISWRERPAASSREYEAAPERVLEIFSERWKMPRVLRSTGLWFALAITAAT